MHNCKVLNQGLNQGDCVGLYEFVHACVRVMYTHNSEIIMFSNWCVHIRTTYTDHMTSHSKFWHNLI